MSTNQTPDPDAAARAVHAVLRGVRFPDDNGYAAQPYLHPRNVERWKAETSWVQAYCREAAAAALAADPTRVALLRLLAAAWEWHNAFGPERHRLAWLRFEAVLHDIADNQPALLDAARAAARGEGG